MQRNAQLLTTAWTKTGRVQGDDTRHRGHTEIARPTKLGSATGALMDETIKVFMVKDPDGNSIPFGQTLDATTAKDAVPIACADYEAYVASNRV